MAGGAVSLAIFDDRVEVWSAGEFPRGITAEALSKSHPSVQCNPLIAEVFFRAGLIEKWGRGTNRVIAMCRDAGIEPPRFEEIAGAAVVRFRVNVRAIPVQHVPPPEAVSKERSKEKTGRKSKEKSKEKIIRLISLNPKATIRSLADALGLSHAGVEKVLRRLKQAGVIRRVGPDKGGKWELARS